jgi:hypothetical protein
MLSTLRTLWRTLSAKTSRKGCPRLRRRPAGFRPVLESLEERAVPASISYSTLLPGEVFASAVNSSGDVYVTGNGFVAELNPTGTTVLYDTTTTIGRGTGIAVDSAGDAYVIGSGLGVPTTPNAIASTESGDEDVVAELNPAGSIVYATYLPGTDGNGLTTMGNNGAIAVDSAGNIYVAGSAGAGLPVTPGAFQTADLAPTGSTNAFFAKIDPALSGSASLVYASYLGGSASSYGDAATGIAVDSFGNAYLTGYTTSSNFPTTSGAFQTTLEAAASTPSWRSSIPRFPERHRSCTQRIWAAVAPKATCPTARPFTMRETMAGSR